MAKDADDKFGYDDKEIDLKYGKITIRPTSEHMLGHSKSTRHKNNLNLCRSYISPSVY